MINLPLCYWLSQMFDLRAPSSTDVPVLLLNQPTIKTERTQIHFLSDVLVTVASLDLKVPIGAASQTLLTRVRLRPRRRLVLVPRALSFSFSQPPCDTKGPLRRRESLGRNIPVKTFLSTPQRGVLSVWINLGPVYIEVGDPR